MKKLYTTLSVLGLTSLAMAQPVMQASDLNPTVGEVYNYEVTQWVPEGNWGNNVTWDLSTMIPSSSSSVTVNAANPLFPLSNVSLLDAGGSTTYQENSSTGQYVHGIDAGGTIITYQNPAKQLVFPLNENVNETDTWAATFTSGGLPFDRAGTNLIFADAWGTLITPEGTFTDVWRVRVDQDYVDTYAGGTIVYQVQVFMWYKAGIHYPLATVADVATSQGSAYTYGTYTLLDSWGVEEEANTAFRLFPNPVQENLNVEFASAEAVQALRIYNALGNLVNEVEVNSFSKNITVDMSSLSSGIYFVKGVTTEGTETTEQKVVKQ